MGRSLSADGLSVISLVRSPLDGLRVCDRTRFSGVRRLLLLLLSVVALLAPACGDDGTSLSCGSGTDEVDGECVPSDNGSGPADDEVGSTGSIDSLGSEDPEASGQELCALVNQMQQAQSAFTDDALDGTTGEMPGPEEMHEVLISMAEAADSVEEVADGDALTAAQSILDAALRFDDFLDGYGYDLREFDYPGDTPIDDELNDIIFVIDFDALGRAQEECAP